jgi:hypothetical protein
MYIEYIWILGVKFNFYFVVIIWLAMWIEGLYKFSASYIKQIYIDWSKTFCGWLWGFKRDDHFESFLWIMGINTFIVAPAIVVWPIFDIVFLYFFYIKTMRWRKRKKNC